MGTDNCGVGGVVYLGCAADGAGVAHDSGHAQQYRWCSHSVDLPWRRKAVVRQIGRVGMMLKGLAMWAVMIACEGIDVADSTDVADGIGGVGSAGDVMWRCCHLYFVVVLMVLIMLAVLVFLMELMVLLMALAALAAQLISGLVGITGGADVVDGAR